MTYRESNDPTQRSASGVELDQGRAEAQAADDNVVPLQRRDVDFPRLISACTTDFELFSACDQISKFFGFSFFSIIRLPENSSETLSSLGLMSNLPTFLITEYDSLGLLENSPVIAHLTTSIEPLPWTIEELDSVRAADKKGIVASLFTKHGLQSGAHFSVRLADGYAGGVSFSGCRAVPDYGEVVELNFLSNLVFTRLHEIRSKGRIAQFGLKPREIECLQWTSEGKTSGEIATILDLSEYTVNHYLANAMRKLDTQNRTHAVAKAFRSRIIR